MTFKKFSPPTENWSKMPHELIDAFPEIETLGELKVIMYILRHTWGFQDERKKITLDEFEHGRKRRDRTRMDNGTGLSRGTIRNGLGRAVRHGFIEVETDDSDLGQVKKYYSICMGDKVEEGQTSTPTGPKVNPGGSKVAPPTEKETLQKDTTRKSDIIPQATLVGVDPPKSKSKSKRKPRVSAGSRKPTTGATVYRSMTDLNPPKSWRADLEAITDLDRWRAVIKAWLGTGYRKVNVQGMLECYQENRMPTTKGAPRVKSVGRSKHHQEATEETKAAFRAHRAEKRRAADVESLRAGPGPPG